MSTTNQKEDPRIAAVREHGRAWKETYTKMLDNTLAKFAAEPLDKKTAIVCTAFLVDAIKEATSCIILAIEASVTDQNFKYIDGPDEPDEPRRHEDWPRPWIHQILVEIQGQIDVSLIDAYLNAHSFYDSEAQLSEMASGKMEPEKAEKLLAREFAEIAKYPLPTERSQELG
jgi:hypothetical protein